MSTDPFDALRQATTNESDSHFRKKVEKNRRETRIGNITRRTCRWVILVCGVLSALGIADAVCTQGKWLIGYLLCPNFLLIIVAGAVLFLFGGLAPPRVRLVLTDRERKILDE